MTAPMPPAELPESSPVAAAMLTLAEELEEIASANDESVRASRLGSAHGARHTGLRDASRDAADRIRTAVAAALAADPEPREDVVAGPYSGDVDRGTVVESRETAVERMAEMLQLAAHTYAGDEARAVRGYWRHLAAAALDASREGTK